MSKTVDLIYQKLSEEYSPAMLEIQDDSHKHIGHAGNTGGGHYTVFIQAEALKGMSRVRAHQDIYKTLDELLPEKIHALSIQLR